MLRCMGTHHRRQHQHGRKWIAETRRQAPFKALLSKAFKSFDANFEAHKPSLHFIYTARTHEHMLCLLDADVMVPEMFSQLATGVSSARFSLTDSSACALSRPYTYFTQATQFSRWNRLSDSQNANYILPSAVLKPIALGFSHKHCSPLLWLTHKLHCFRCKCTQS
jgi:hypothetical protein